MERLLFIVSQGRRELYDSLRVLLGQERNVEVILDRRVVKRRRRHEAPPAMERRRFGRRGRPAEDSEIVGAARQLLLVVRADSGELLCRQRQVAHCRRCLPACYAGAGRGRQLREGDRNVRARRGEQRASGTSCDAADEFRN